MGFDRTELAALIACHGRVARVVLAAVHGSTPREAGAAMCLWPGGQAGTIGGGAMEHRAMMRALELLASGGDDLMRLPLGPVLGQCCGGSVTLVIELWDAARLAAVTDPLLARPLPGQGGDMPFAVQKLLSTARAEGAVPLTPRLIQGWLVEPLTPPPRALWIWGAGHVGRAIARVMAPLPGLALTWVDTDRARFPDILPPGVTVLADADPGGLVASAPRDADHLVLTFSHALDLDLCHRLLAHGFASLGLIGSATKWARFQSRLAALGHPPAEIARILCPIGRPALGKDPQAIAIGVAADLLERGRGARARAATGTGGWVQ